MTAIHFDMETSDPDDVMTLAILATHPTAKLVGVTLTPGGREQYSLVKHVLKLLGRENVPVGSYAPDRTKPCVSEFHYNWLGTPPVTTNKIHEARHVLMDVLLDHPDATFLTGAPLKNYGDYASIKVAGLGFFKRWVGQGGFAGDAVVPPEHRLEKFQGRNTCATFNFNGDVLAAHGILKDPRIEERVLVSKNVCHGIAWDEDWHRRVRNRYASSTDGVKLVYDGMSHYLRKHAQGKLLHDPLALAVAIDPTIATLADVVVYREKGAWGSRFPEADEKPDAKITIAVDRERFFQTLIGD